MNLKISYFALVLFYTNLVESKLETPPQFLKPGIVAVISAKCEHSKKLIKFLEERKLPHTKIYLENDEDAFYFVKKEMQSKVPWVYENGVLIGDGYDFMAKYPQSNSEFSAPLTSQDPNGNKKINLLGKNSARQSTLLFDGKEFKIINH